MEQWENQGYDVERNFINPDNISYNLQCSICDEVFNNPMRLNCGHTFCYGCISDWMKRQAICPNCRVNIVESEISRDLLAFNLIEELEVSCNNGNIGCPWKGSLSNLKNHLKFCNENIECLKNMPSHVSTPLTSKFKRTKEEMEQNNNDNKSSLLLKTVMEKQNRHIDDEMPQLTKESKDAMNKYLTSIKKNATK